MKLNPEQEKAAAFLNGICVVVAVPGSGKTRTMMERIGILVNEYNIPPENILGLTFTKIGMSTTPVTKAVPIGIFFISFSVSVVIPSTDLLRALTSLGLVTLRIICVLTCEIAFFSTRLGL